MRFKVVVGNDVCAVEFAFGGEQELTEVGHWRVPSAVARKPGVRDTVEFARLASKRWRYYRRSIATATRLRTFQSIISRNRYAEISVLLVARAEWFDRSHILGLAQCRRTYCHHMVLEFLSVHPAIVGGATPRVRGVGTGLLCGLAALCMRLRMQLLWGEATAYSAPFYAKILSVPRINDHFFIGGASLARCDRSFRDKFQGTLEQRREI